MTLRGRQCSSAPRALAPPPQQGGGGGGGDYRRPPHPTPWPHPRGRLTYGVVGARLASSVLQREGLGDPDAHAAVGRALQGLYRRVEAARLHARLVHVDEPVARHEAAVRLRHAARDEAADDDHRLRGVEGVLEEEGERREGGRGREGGWEGGREGVREGEREAVRLRHATGQKAAERREREGGGREGGREVGREGGREGEGGR